MDEITTQDEAVQGAPQGTARRMKPTIKDLTNLVANRICIICGKSVPEKQGILHLRLRLLTHISECTEKFREISKDRSKSARGRKRPINEVLSLIEWMN